MLLYAAGSSLSSPFRGRWISRSSEIGSSRLQLISKARNMDFTHTPQSNEIRCSAAKNDDESGRFEEQTQSGLSRVTLGEHLVSSIYYSAEVTSPSPSRSVFGAAETSVSLSDRSLPTSKAQMARVALLRPRSKNTIQEEDLGRPCFAAFA